MKFLIDNALSPRVAALLCAAGHDAMHVNEIGLGASEDTAILLRAGEEGRTIVSADADFTALLAMGSRRTPSIILFRGPSPRRAADIASTLLRLLPSLEPDLVSGAAVSVRGETVRIRSLPIRRTPKRAGP